MKFRFAVFGALIAMPLAAVSAQDRAEGEEYERERQPVRCVSPTVLVSPFNNSPGALEQSRVAATTVESIRQRRGQQAYRVCQTSAVAPEISEIKGVNEKPLTEEEMEQVEAAAEEASERG